MKFFAASLLAAALAMNMTADDRMKDKTKSETVDPVTGEKVKTKSRAKIEHDGDYKEKTTVESKGPAGKTKAKHKVKAEPGGDYKEKTKVNGPDGKYESKTKVDK